ncbi:MAG TPA: hypothetical protein VL961_02500, partial [Acidimicrobiales bacterium]|nr:hypothetical protein [Acidimicrobiales bacterium]
GDGSVRDLDLHDVVSVCRRLDGIPLAIELAVVRMRTMSLGEILRKLDDRFDLLTGGSRSAMARQQTLRAAVDWSYDLLNRSEATTLCLLSIFAGGFSGDDAELVGADAVGGPVRFREVLHSLVDKSLVAVDTGAPVTRYRLNDSIRLYAAERLAEQGESVRGAALDAHGRLFLALAEEAAPHLVGGAQQVWLDRLDQEKDNLRLALQYLLAAPGRQVHALRMCVALRRFWFARGYWTEAGELLATALELPGAHAERELRAAVLCAAGQMAGRRSDHVGARALFEEGLELGRELGLDGIEAECLCGIGWAAYSLGDLGTARSVIDHAVEKARTCGNAQVLGMVLERRASINYEDHDACRADYVEALEHLRGAGDLLNIGVVENNMADLELIAARPDRARPHVEAALAISDMLHDESIMYNFLNLGHVEFMSADVDRARTLYVDAFRSARRIGDHFMVANSVLGLALCRTASPDAVAAAELHGVADALMEKSGGTHEVVERALRAQDHATLRATLGDDAFDLAYSSGRSRADRSGAEAALILSP